MSILPAHKKLVADPSRIQAIANLLDGWRLDVIPTPNFHFIILVHKDGLQIGVNLMAESSQFVFTPEYQLSILKPLTRFVPECDRRSIKISTIKSNDIIARELKRRLIDNALVAYQAAVKKFEEKKKAVLDAREAAIKLVVPFEVTMYSGSSNALKVDKGGSTGSIEVNDGDFTCSIELSNVSIAKVRKILKIL